MAGTKKNYAETIKKLGVQKVGCKLKNYFFPSWEINFFISQPELEKKLVKLVAKESHMLKEYI